MTQLDIINKIKKELNVKLAELDIINWNSKGYTVNHNGQITVLALNDCEIKNLKRFTSFLKDLTQLQSLNLRSNQISDYSFLKDLTQLQSLNLSYNQIRDISPLRYLTSLTELWIGYNQLSDISPLKELKQVKDLQLYGNQINDISALRELTRITWLDLDDNRIQNLTPLEDLREIKGLLIGNNQIKDITPLKELKQLKRLNLAKIPIKELPSWISQFDMEIKWAEDAHEGFICFFNNPLKRPPPEIVKQGKEAVRNYFEQINEQEEDYLFEAKMLIVGEPGAGKTSMAWKMENANCKLPKENETTKGIDVKQYYFPLQKEDFSAFKHPEKLENRKFCLNLWDFGGQDIYKATHRFFLSNRSLYALVADSRNEDTDFNYWLHIVEMFGGDSPLLIVLNEKHQRKRNLDTSEMQNRFTNISEVIDVDFAEQDKTRLSKLKRAVKYYVSQLPLVGSPVPAKWTDVREALENDDRNTITLHDYLKICNDVGMTRLKDALVLSQYFHDIGVFLHFQDDVLLKKTIFLKPNWATKAVYKILDHELLNQKKGKFNREDANTIWSEDEYEFVRDELLRLMKNFFLTYEIENSGEFIVPERLQQAQPKYNWNEKNNLLLRYEYDLFMPKGVMSQFTVLMHPYIGNHDHVWVRGVVLKREKTTAEIIETYDARKIKIRISGNNRRDFMTIITENIDKINSRFEKMKVDKMIPCNCDECKKDDQPYFFEYVKLKRRLDNNISVIDCENSFKKVNIRSLIDEVINEETLTSSENEIISASGDHQEEVKRNKVFVSYSHKDKQWLERVQTHLKVLESEGISVNLWDDTQIKAGMKWRKEIENGLLTAKVAILLVSTDFLASDFIRKNELPPLLKSAENDGATILPLILKPCRYSTSGLSDFQAVNDPKEAPLSKIKDDEQDETLLKLAGRVAELMNKNTPA